MAHIALYITALVVLIPCIFLTLVPMLPALSGMFLVSLIYALAGGFSVLSGNELLFLLIPVIASIITDHSSGIIGAKYGGAHGKSLLWGIAGSIVGAFAFPPFGSLVGLFIAVLGAEIYYSKTHRQAIKAATGALAGTAVGIALNFALAVLFFGLFAFFAIS
jgi:hypothetical protein